MFDRVIGYFIYHPRRLIELGGIVTTCSLLLCLFGMFGQLATKMPSILFSITKHPVAERTLADLYPALPTWWIPESFFGWTFSVTLLATGLWLTLIGKHLNRVYDL